MVGETKELSSKDFPEKSLGRVFPNFGDFRKELKTKLGDVILKIVKNIEENEQGIKETDWVKSKEGLTYFNSQFGLGILWEFVARNFYYKYRNREYAGEQRDFIDEFTAELAFIVAEIRRKEHVWTQFFLQVDKITKIDRTEIERISSSDKGGKTTQGDSSKYQILSKDLTDKTNQHGKVSSFDQKGSTITTTHKGTNYVPLGKILGALNNLQIDFSSFYPRFEHLWNHYCSPSLEWVIDKTTGRRKWVTEEEYEEIMEPEKPKPKKLGVDPHDVLKEYFRTGNWEKYLEALTVYHNENEKEYNKLPDTSNRKPRIAARIKHGNNFLKAYKKEVKRGGEFKFITAEEFMARINGEREGFVKVVGYENIIKLVADYLTSWYFWQKWGGEKPQQLMIGLLGDPGLGKTYICQAIGKALEVGYYRISLNGKNSSGVIYGTSIENPGFEMGGIAKAISENKSQFTVVFFDEIEKAGKEAKDAIGEPTDRTGNKEFKDAFYDFITPCNNLLFFCALNYAEELPDFIRDRFTMISVEPPTYEQRIEILRALLAGSLKKFEEPFQGIWHKNWEEIYNTFNQEELFKKALTKTMSIRGAKDNIASLINTMRVNFLVPEKTLTYDIIDYDWGFKPKEELDVGDKRRGRLPCPHGEEKKQKGTSNKLHRRGCKCFVNNLDRVPGWIDNMGDEPTPTGSEEGENDEYSQF